MGYAKKGTVYRTTKFYKKTTLADSHLNGWLSGLRKSLKRGTLSRMEYEEAVEVYIRFNRGNIGHRTYNELMCD